jgi:glycosyltransferase involved in cell wall biosynthesis
MNVLPLASSLPGVVTVHDLAFVRTPEKLPPLKRFYLTQLCAASVARAQRVIAVSRQTAADVIDCLHVDPAKVRVVHNGVAAHFTPGDPAAAARFRAEHNLAERFVLYLGTLEPRKNLERLVRAFARWRQADPDAADVKLVLAGGKGWYFDTIFQTVAALGLAGDVVFPGYVPAAELPDWYRAATVFVYPSLFEGFGLPVLEAMACGTPVVCSSRSSLPEVAGSAALMVDPDDSTQTAAAIVRVLEDAQLAAKLHEKGMRQAAQFTWTRTAATTLKAYEQILSLK